MGTVWDEKETALSRPSLFFQGHLDDGKGGGAGRVTGGPLFAALSQKEIQGFNDDARDG